MAGIGGQEVLGYIMPWGSILGPWLAVITEGIRLRLQKPNAGSIAVC